MALRPPWNSTKLSIIRRIIWKSLVPAVIISSTKRSTIDDRLEYIKDPFSWFIFFRSFKPFIVDMWYWVAIELHCFFLRERCEAEDAIIACRRVKSCSAIGNIRSLYPLEIVFIATIAGATCSETGEVVSKYGLLSDEDYWQWLSRNRDCGSMVSSSCGGENSWLRYFVIFEDLIPLSGSVFVLLRRSGVEYSWTMPINACCGGKAPSSSAVSFLILQPLARSR